MLDKLVDKVFDFTYRLGCLFFIAGIPMYFVYLFIKKIIGENNAVLYFTLASLTICIIAIICMSIKIAKNEDEIRETNSESERQVKKSKEELKKKDKEISDKNSLISFYEYAIHTKTPFREVAEMVSDFETSVIKKEEDRLRYKPRPARSAADEVREIRNLFRENLCECKQMLYKYEFLLETFPELREYVEDEQRLIQIKQYDNFNDVKDNSDRVRDWLTKEEYEKLSTTRRNQLALDRYKNRKKSNWELGAEYEMYIGHLLREGKIIKNTKFFVEQFGINKRLEDLGRDIIAENLGLDGIRHIYIIQCKRWSKDKVLHENVVCQLFGTTIMYEIEHANYNNAQFHPVLISTADLSNTAKAFAKRLNVTVITKEFGEYPMIKCNRVSMIYHLPFDQQYHTTIISEADGDFYAYTVQEAENKGFRRAKKYYGPINS